MSDNRHEVITIAELRAKRGKMSQGELAKELGTSQTTVSKWEKNIKSISVPYLFKICSYFGVSADSVLGTGKNKDEQ